MQDLRFVVTAIQKHIRNSAELRLSFWLSVLGMVVNNTAFIVLWIPFVQTVGVIHGWTAISIIGLQGFTSLCYGFTHSFTAGIRSMGEAITNGSFDAFLLSPKNLILRVATSAFRISALGDVMFGALCITIFAIFSHISLIQLALIGLCVVLTGIACFAVTLAAYSMGFYITDGMMVSNGFFDLFLAPALFHGGAFQGFTRFFFTFIVPSLVIGTLPVETIQEVSWQKLLLITVVTCAWLCIALGIFQHGVKRYESSNLMTFGA